MHLDANFLVALGDRDSSEQVRARAWLARGESLEASSLAWAEYLCGPLRAEEAKNCLALLSAIPAVDAGIAALGAQLFNATGRRRRSLPDCIIAATAILANQPLAPLNKADFLPFQPYGLRLAME